MLKGDPAHPKMAPTRGDFYVEEVCCTACGVPQTIAPQLVGWREDGSLTLCYWIRQPETAEEVDKAIKIIHAQELGCHRYGEGIRRYSRGYRERSAISTIRGIRFVTGGSSGLRRCRLGFRLWNHEEWEACLGDCGAGLFGDGED